MVMVRVVMIGVIVVGVVMVMGIAGMIFRSVVLDAVAIVVVVRVRRGLSGINAVHRLADFKHSLGAIGLVGEDQPLAMFGEDSGVDSGFAAA